MINKNIRMANLQKGFTLIELLVVIGILAILLAITLIAINPARQFSQANNTKRSSDVNAILNAVNQYMADNNGQVPTGVDGVVRTITSTADDPSGVRTVNLCSALVTRYLADMPLDPQTGAESPASSVCNAVGATYDTQYTIILNAPDNRITVAAPDAELQETISVTR